MIHKATASLVCAIVLVSAGMANADWFDNFNGGTTHYTWSWSYDGALVTLPQNDVYEISTYGTPPGWATFGIGVVGGPGNSITNGTISADLNPGGQYTIDDVLGVVIRADTLSGNGYLAAVNPTTGSFDLVRSDGMVLTGLADASLSLSTTQEYRVSIDAWGADLEATLFDSGGGILATLSATDSTYASGFGGLFASYDPDAPLPLLFAAFDNARFATIPEPTTAILMGLGGLGLFGAARRRRRNRK